MTSAFLFLMTLCLSLSGFAFLAASQLQHRAALFRHFTILSAPPRLLRWSGSAMLFASFWLALARDGAGLGSVVWILINAIAAFIVSLALTLMKRYKPHYTNTSAATSDEE